MIHPGTKKIYDQWQYNKFDRLVDTILKNYGIKVILTSGSGEESQVENVIKFLKTVKKIYSNGPSRVELYYSGVFICCLP